MTKSLTLTSETDERLDRLLTARIQSLPEYQGLSRSQLKRWIEQGQVLIDGEVSTKAGTLVRAGSHVTVQVLDPAASALSAYEYPLSILFEDEHLLVIDKPAGLSMHPGAGNNSRTLVNALISHFSGDQSLPETLRQDASIQGAKVQRPGIVHRLDKDTTGVVVVAKTVMAHAALSAQFAARTVDRRYFALAFITPRGKRPLNVQEQGMIDAPLSRNPAKRTQMSIAKKAGKRAVTYWRVKERLGYAALVELKLETGRTHQIRIHLSSIGCPVIGDMTYGDFSGLPQALKRLHEQMRRQALHAATLRFEHPATKERLSFTSELPVDMAALIEAFRSHGDR
jgi:23S rRNA pseudouridine1911/1915/1917 synthase